MFLQNSFWVLYILCSAERKRVHAGPRAAKKRLRFAADVFSRRTVLREGRITSAEQQRKIIAVFMLKGFVCSCRTAFGYCIFCVQPKKNVYAPGRTPQKKQDGFPG